MGEKRRKKSSGKITPIIIQSAESVPSVRRKGLSRLRPTLTPGAIQPARPRRCGGYPDDRSEQDR